MANTNVLEGIACPKCGYEEEFAIEATSLFPDVTDAGVGYSSDVEWTNDSFIRCDGCNHEGTVKEFTTKEVN